MVQPLVESTTTMMRSAPRSARPFAPKNEGASAYLREHRFVRIMVSAEICYNNSHFSVQLVSLFLEFNCHDVFPRRSRSGP